MTGMSCTAMETPELPIEIIIYILGFLHASDRKEASLVCRSWYEASQDPRYQRNLTFRFPASTSSLDLIHGLGARSSCSLIISHLDGSSVSRAMLLKVGLHLGPRLEGLALPGSSVTEATLLGLLPRLTALRRLDLRGLDSLFMSGTFLSREEHRQQVRAALAGLEELDLSDLRYLSDLTFNRLTGCTPRLQRLSLAGCHIAFEFDPYCGCPVGVGPGSSALLSLRNLRRLLQEQTPTLQGLDLSRTSITPGSLRSISQVEGLRLRELSLRGCKELTDYSVEVLCKHQPGLRSLDLSGCTELTSRAALAVATGLQGLRSFSLSRDWRVTEKGLADLVALPELRSLDLSECPHVSGAEMVKGLSGRQRRPCLETLSFKSCTYTRDLVVFSLAQLLGSSLKELDLTSCVHLTDVSVRAIASYLRGLEVLRLGWCKEITDWGLLGMVEPTKKCEPTQDMEGPSFTRTFGNMGFFRPPSPPFQDKPRVVSEEDLEVFREQEGGSLLALRALRELDLSGCSRLTDSSITQVLRFPDLQRLSLSMLPDISDASVASVASHCRSLTSLALSHCPQISDHALVRAAPHLARLQHLYLACCDRITDRSLSVLAQHCERLRTLDISMCKDITITAVDLLQSQLPYLENVHCRFVGGADLTLTL